MGFAHTQHPTSLGHYRLYFLDVTQLCHGLGCLRDANNFANRCRIANLVDCPSLGVENSPVIILRPTFVLQEPFAHSILPNHEPFEPMASLIEQEWLLQGMPLSVVVATIRGRACPLYVPDPRWMALHKLWLAEKPQRNPAKKTKDMRQGNVLLDAVRYFLSDIYPLDIDFVFALPPELRPIFNEWCHSRSYIPSDY